MALKRRNEGAEMTTNDKSLARNYDSVKHVQKSAIDSDIGVLDSDLQRIRAEEIVFYN